ncbi:MAG: hypothetical protein GY854_16775 [Deltaproteobacteria bacterium]|nr:hypothetical protein [Deltaproteobacteria bacterium]
MQIRRVIVLGLLFVACLVAFSGQAQESETGGDESAATDPAKTDAGPESDSDVDAGPEDDAVTDGDAGPEEDGGAVAVVGEEELEPSIPDKEEPDEIDESQFPDMDEELEEDLPFNKGMWEIGPILAMAGSSDYFYLGVGALFDYFVMDRLAPGIELTYTHLFLSQDYGYSEPHTLTAMPFLKFMIMRSWSVSPYILVAGAYQHEWGSDFAVSGWGIGGGGGVYVFFSKRVALNIRLLFLYYWYSDKKVYLYNDDVFATAEKDPNTDEETGEWYFEREENGQTIRYYKSDDVKDRKSEPVFPLISFGISIFF